MVSSIVRNSEGKNDIMMDPVVGDATNKLRSFLFEAVYRNPLAKSEEGKAKELLARLYEYYVKHPERMPLSYCKNLEREGVERCVCDFLSGMTDRYAIETYNELFVPKVWRGQA